MVPATKRELSSASVVVWAGLVRACAGVVRPGPELRPERGFESSGRMRVSAYASSSDEPQEGHGSPSTAISDVQAGHLIGRWIVSLEKFRPVPFQHRGTHQDTQSPGGMFSDRGSFHVTFCKGRRR